MTQSEILTRLQAIRTIIVDGLNDEDADRQNLCEDAERLVVELIDDMEATPQR